MRIFCLFSDLYDSVGGIAKVNRDLVQALCAWPGTERVYALPRREPRRLGESPDKLPEKLVHLTAGAGGKIRYGVELLSSGTAIQSCDLVICGHINLLPFAQLCKARWGCPLLLIIHGIDAWQPTRHLLANRLARRVDHLVSVSRFTLEQFRDWAGARQGSTTIIPNAVDLGAFAPGPADPALLERYRLGGRRVIMSLSRLPGPDRHKGIDEVLDVLPRLIKRIPELTYLVVGEGPDRDRLEGKAWNLGLSQNVVFTGAVSEAEKAAHYRLAELFILAGRGEGFGIVLLEAMASGVPVVASTRDASQEVLQGGLLGGLVDPDNLQDLEAGILHALDHPIRVEREALTCYAYDSFAAAWQTVLSGIEGRPE